MILDQLEKLAGDRPCAESIRLQLKRQEFAKAAETAATFMRGMNALPAKDIMLAADALVVAFDDLPQPSGLPEAINGELDRIHAALKSMGQQNNGCALDLIKPIGLRSPFGNWKWLIKGLSAFYAAEDDRALVAFAKIDAGSAAAAFAEPYARLLAGDLGNDATAKDAAFVEEVCCAAGFDVLAPVIARADYLWRVQRFRDAYDHLHGRVEGFPSIKSGIERTLTELFYNSCLEMPFDQSQKYLRHLSQSAFSFSASDPIKQLWAQRSLALHTENHSLDDEIILELWEKFLSVHHQFHGDGQKIRALVYRRLGDLFAQVIPDDSPFAFFSIFKRRERATFRNPELAERCYEKSLKADPGAKNTQMALIDFYEKNGQTAKVNKMLDQLIKQFPDEKEVLFKAGNRCLERKALLKGLNYLEQALALDPMDAKVREGFIVACIRAAHAYAQKAEIDKCRALLPRALAVSDAISEDMNRSHGFLYARWSAFELLCHHEAEAAALWEKAIAHQPAGKMTLHFFYWIAARYYGVDHRLLKENEALIQSTLKGPAKAGIAGDLAETLLYFRSLPQAYKFVLRHRKLIHGFMKRSVQEQMSCLEAKAILTYALSNHYYSPDIASLCVRNRLKSDPNDAYFRYQRYLMHQDDARLLPGLKAAMDELTTILKLSREQQEAMVTAEVQKQIQALKSGQDQARHRADPFGSMDLDDEEHDDMEDDELTEAVLRSMIDNLSPPRSSSREGRNSRTKGGRRKKSSSSGPRQMELF